VGKVENTPKQSSEKILGDDSSTKKKLSDEQSIETSRIQVKKFK
jgi:hypothetical protein